VPRRSTKPPFLVSRKLKTWEVFLLLSHTEAKESVPSCQLLHHDIDAKKRSWEKLPFQGQFSYTPLYWEWLEDVLTRCRDLLVANHLFDALYSSFFFTSVQILFGRYANTGAQKQILCIPPRVKLLFLYWTSMASSDFHSRDFNTMRLFPIQGTQE